MLWGYELTAVIVTSTHLKRPKKALKAYARDINNECDPTILEVINEYLL
jgi:hypothetical protein